LGQVQRRVQDLAGLDQELQPLERAAVGGRMGGERAQRKLVLRGYAPPGRQAVGSGLHPTRIKDRVAHAPGSLYGSSARRFRTTRIVKALMHRSAPCS